jgi:hypothetical protein
MENLAGGSQGEKYSGEFLSSAGAGEKEISAH